MYRKPLKKFTNYKSLPIHRQVLPPALKDSVASKGERKKGTYRGRGSCHQSVSIYKDTHSHRIDLVG